MIAALIHHLASCCKAKVSDLGFTTGVDEDVLGLQIAVDYSQIVDICQSFQYLTEKPPAFVYVQAMADPITECLLGKDILDT